MSRGSIGYELGNMNDNERLIAGTATGVGPSPKLWSGCPLLPIMFDPTKGFVFFDDFLKPGEYVTAETHNGILQTDNTDGTVANDPSLAGGILKITASANDGRGPTLQWKGVQVTPAAGTKIWFECRIKIATDVEDILIGLIDDATTDPINGGTVVTNEDDTISDVDKTAYEKFGILIDGVSTVTFFHKGEPIRTISDADDICDAAICPTIEITTDGGGVGASLYLDWMRVAVYKSNGGGRES